MISSIKAESLILIPLCLVLLFQFEGGAADIASRDIEKLSVEQLEKKLKEEPNNAQLWERKGQIYVGYFEDEVALAAFSKAIALKPDFAHAYYERGMYYKGQMKYSQAKQDLMKAMSLLKSSVASHTHEGLMLECAGQLAIVYDMEKNYAAEVPLLRQKVEATNNGYDIARLANCEVKLGQFKDAENDYKQALKLKPDETETHASYAALLAKRGDYAAAVEQYTKAIYFTAKHGRPFLVRQHHLYYEKRAQCYKKLGKDDLAARDMRTLKGLTDGLYDVMPSNQNK